MREISHWTIVKGERMDAYWSEIVTGLVSIGVSYGVMSTQLKNQKEEIDEIKNQLIEYQKDHDLLIRVDTKVDVINTSIKELKGLIENKRSKK